MAFEPDILVTTPGEPQVTLVVEAKTHVPDLEHVEAGLKQYMVGMQCPVGVLITPEHLWLYRDFYTSRAPDSVRRVGDYDLTTVWRQLPPAQESQFEAFVQNWLEDLARAPLSRLPKDLRDALREYIIPAIAGGDIRAAHPRYA